MQQSYNLLSRPLSLAFIFVLWTTTVTVEVKALKQHALKPFENYLKICVSLKKLWILSKFCIYPKNVCVASTRLLQIIILVKIKLFRINNLQNFCWQYNIPRLDNYRHLERLGEAGLPLISWYEFSNNSRQAEMIGIDQPQARKELVLSDSVKIDLQLKP